MTDNNWIEWKWTPEKPYPETLETRVLVKFRDGTEEKLLASTVGFWHSDDNELSNWFNDRTENEDTSFLDILSYRIAEDQ